MTIWSERDTDPPSLALDQSDAVGVRARLRGPLASEAATSADPTETLRARLAVYPGASEGLRVDIPPPGAVPRGGTQEVELWWESSSGDARSLAEIAPPMAGPGSGAYLQPGLGANFDRLSPLAVWWLVLIGLASFARYHPDMWVRALDRDRSKIALPVEEGLAAARELLPFMLRAKLSLS